MTLTTGVWPWVWFNLFVLVLLALDLGVFHRKSHAVSIKEALIWSVVWISLALLFNLGLYFVSGGEVALQFLTGYLIEKSLSVDNIFIFVLLFSYFSVPPAYQHRVLFWGILGALLMRGALIGVGSVLIEQFHWIIYLFGAFLIFTGIKMGVQKESEVHPENNPLVKFVHRFLPVTEGFEKDHFVVRRNGRKMITPLLLVLLVIETSDLLFAVDSIPAIFSVTTDPFIVYTSNVFAILGLRSLYFVFANIIHKFYYLQTGLAVILCFVGVKMLLPGLLHIHIPTYASLLFIALVLVIAIVASVIRSRRLAGTRQGDVERAEKV
ncbi:membrane protein [Dictyobacter vulcani]|uniref:Membrane protein n=1 Tax=Dictyobacter vulcani TaxID=2607529 RepID=A0A5J4KPM0_9CHLR|nr:TerC family protein [Dictyobacter vulcani]GER91334.1 membrane protein [Dictyobacter vulcani]